MQKAKNSLISLTRQILELEQSLIESNGEITNDIDSQLAITEENYPVKVDNYAAVLDRLDATEQWIKIQMDEFKDALRRIDRARDGLHFRLGQAMDMLKKTELEGNHVVFEIKESRGKVVITDESALDPIFTKSELVIHPDKIAIAKAINDGQKVAGASLVKEKKIKKSIKIN